MSDLKRIVYFVWVCALGMLVAACKPAPEPIKPILKPKAEVVEDINRYQAQPIGDAAGEYPWVSHIDAVDLDQDGRLDLIGCEARDNEIFWLKQTEVGDFQEITLAEDMKGPVHVEAVDMDKDGDLDLLVASMSVIFPNNDHIGFVYILENDGAQKFTRRAVLENVMRVSDVRAGDFNGDGELDLVVGQFGYDQGEIRWLERTGFWAFKSHNLLNLSGTVHVCVADYDRDGSEDIATQISQQWEEVHVFLNDGKGNFSNKVVFGSTNEDFASSGMTLGDLNQDGRADLLFANGDGFGPTPVPGSRPWHGVQWLENKGGGDFEYHRIGDLPGAYSPIECDLDLDGHMDVIASSCFNDWFKPKHESLMWFRNNGDMSFTPHVMAYDPTHLLTLEVADFDGSGIPSIISGAFHAWPPYESMTRLMMWKPKGGE
ncbi:VCBS repeat-containing protein [bacterium]|nr:VCBS repeat-containing protein [bacterium]